MIVLVGRIVLIFVAFLSNVIELTFDDVRYVVACLAVLVAILVWLLGGENRAEAIKDLMASAYVAEAKQHSYLLLD